MAGPVVVPTSNAAVLGNSILGPGITASNFVYTGATNQSGTFTGGLSTVGFDRGIVLTTGDATAISGPNQSSSETVGGGGAGDDFSVDRGGAGYAPLEALNGGLPTWDAAVLSFDFQFDSGTGSDLFFNFVFASEEYVNWIDSEYNDVFGFWIDGVNIALTPGTGDPITVNTINNTTNPSLYRNNVENTDGIPNLGLDMTIDGLTVVLQARRLNLGPGTHTMVFAVADTEDHILDAAVFIQGGSFSGGDDGATSVPEPTALSLLGSALLGLGLVRRLRS
jgi:hypothetical protein